MRLLALALLVLARPVAAEVPGWTVQTVPGKPACGFSLAADGAIDVVADGSVAFLVREVAPGEARVRLTWRWRVDAAPAPTDLARKGGDDRPLALHVVFPPAPGEGLLARATRWMSQSGIVGSRTLTFVWGGTAPPGTRLRNPYRPDDGAIVVLRGAETPLGEWREEIVDLAAEYRAAFGAALPSATHIAISADTDDRGGLARGRIAPPRFVEAP